MPLRFGAIETALQRLATVILLGIAGYGAYAALDTERLSTFDADLARRLEHQLASLDLAPQEAESARPPAATGLHAPEARFVYDPKSDEYRDCDTGHLVARADLPYPPNHGFLSAQRSVLKPGTIVDRYGSPLGRFCGTPGDTISMRGMPEGDNDLPYYRYEVKQPIDVLAGPSAPVPAFGATGGGLQYLFPEPIQSLVQQGNLVQLP